jgi:RHS repeat-associated protein
LIAKATDDKGAVTTSAARTITVEGTVVSGNVYYIHSDHLETPREITNEQNQTVWKNPPLTEPFGSTPVDDDPDGDGQTFTFNLRFPGQYYDQETGTHYNYYRDNYLPDFGRYGQSDPIGLEGGINTYWYVGGNPLIYIDPLGLAVQGSWMQTPRLNIQDWGIRFQGLVRPSSFEWGYLKIFRFRGYFSGYINIDVKCWDDCREWEIHTRILVGLQSTFDIGPNAYAFIAGLVTGNAYVGVSANILIMGAALLEAEYRFLNLIGQKGGSLISGLIADGPNLICLGFER